jgi:hypothetical protein
VFCSKCGLETPDDSQFCRKCGQAVGAVSNTSAAVLAPSKPKAPLVRWPFMALAALLALFIWFAVGANKSSNPNGPNPIQQLVKQQRTQTLNNPALAVGANRYSYFKLDVPPGATGVQLQGNFTASGGSGNDVEVYVLPETDFVNWQNRHAAKTYYNSGKVTVGNLNLTLPPDAGSYYLVFDNRFSLLSQKSVRLNATLTYYE